MAVFTLSPLLSTVIRQQLPLGDFWMMPREGNFVYIIFMDRIEPLDGLRGIAVLFVFFSHTSGRDQFLLESLNFRGIGHIGVYLFFVLSSFLLGIGLFSKDFNFRIVRKFFVKRILRIIPLYFIVVFGVYFFQNLTGLYSEKYLFVSEGNKGLIEHLLFLKGDGVFWSIVIEMQFYLLVPFLAYLLIKSFDFGWRFLVFIALGNFLLYLSKFGLGIGYIDYVTPNFVGKGTFIDVFIPGIFASYIAINDKKAIEKFLPAFHMVAIIIFFVAVILSICLVSENFLGLNRPFYGFRFFSIYFGVSFSIFVLSIYLNSPYVKFLENKLLRHIGLVGFSFYLLHMGVLHFVNNFFHGNIIKFVISFLIILPASTITFYLIEKPSINLSRYLNKRLDSIGNKSLDQ